MLSKTKEYNQCMSIQAIKTALVNSDHARIYSLAKSSTNTDVSTLLEKFLAKENKLVTTNQVVKNNLLNLVSAIFILNQKENAKQRSYFSDKFISTLENLE